MEFCNSVIQGGIMKYNKLFSTGNIGALEIKNRVVVTPVGVGFANSNGEAGDQLFAYLEERAKGGAGIVMPGIVMVDSKTGKAHANQLALENIEQAIKFAELARMVHQYDAKIFLQLYHPGKQTDSTKLGGLQPWSASENKTANGETTKEMTKEDIKYIISRFANAAKLAKQSGVDGVEIHAAHGYLLNQFLTPLHNRRTDEYGGTLENRMRIVVEVYEAIREAVGNNFIVGIRVSADEFIEGGNTLNEGIEMAKRWDSLGVDYINVNCGLQESSQFNREPPSFQQGWKKNIAKSIKAVVKCPVIAVNTIKKPDFAESLLEEAVCDFIGLSRPHLADPYWTKKTMEGKEDEIRTCISCLNCFESLLKTGLLTCTVNPCIGREREFANPEKNGEGRQVVVIGSGPGGMEAARVLSLRGFKVTLFEKNSELGGQLNYADKPPMKEKITWLKQGLETQVKNAGVDILLDTEATVEKIKKINPVAVFVACGSHPIVPNSIEGIHNENVYTVPEVLSGKVELKNKKVAIIGSGLAGMETAAFLGARCCKTYIIEMQPTIGEGVYYQVLNDELEQLKKYDTEFYPGNKLSKITCSSVEAISLDGKKLEIPVDAVVLSMGVVPNKKIVNEIKNNFKKVVVVGDADKPGKIINAITDGFTKAWVLDV